MSTTTTNYKLVKPELTDPADITAMNPNWDLIDSELKNRALLKHTHVADDLPIVPITKGGFGATTAEKALENLGLTATASELNYMDGVTSPVQDQFNTLKADIESSSIQTASATSTDGIAYTATIKNVTNLYAGLAIFFVPNKNSASTAPTLNLNNLGAKNIRRKLSMGTGSTSVGQQNAWFYAGRPSLLVYDGTQWIAEDFTKPCAIDLYGSVPVANGGTGANNAEDARTNLGITPENIGAAKEKHTHPMEDLLTGTLGIAGGGTGATTASQALTNLGAAPASHKHSASDITSGAVSINRGGTGATSASSARTALGITPANIGALPTVGGNMTGDINFGNNTNGLAWTTDDGTLMALRPDTDLNLFQLVFVPKDGTPYEAFGVKSDGTPMFHKALPISEGGTGATDAATARANLGVAQAVHTHSKSQITDFPTSMPASDVSAWAKASTKPTYTAGEVGALSTNGGHVTGGANVVQFNTPDTNGEVSIGFSQNDKVKWVAGLSAGGASDSFAIWNNVAQANDLVVQPNGELFFRKALPIVSGGTGAYDAPTARANLGITPENIGAFPFTGGNMKGSIGFGETYYNINWQYADGRTWSVRPDPSIDMFQIVRTKPDGKSYGYLNIDADGNVSFNAPLSVSTGGTGSNNKKDARKNLGMEIQCGVVNDVGTSGVQVTFPETFSGVPVVTATGGSENTSVYVRNVTATGFTLVSGNGNNDGVQWQAIYISN